MMYSPRESLHVCHVRIDLEPLLDPRLHLCLQMMWKTRWREDRRVTGTRVTTQLHVLHVAQVGRWLIVTVRQKR